MSSEPIGFVIKRPEPGDSGESIIFITRPSAGPFGTSGTAIFACNDIQSKGDHFTVMTDKGLVEFSKDLPFLKVPRSVTYPVTTKEAAEMQLAEKKEWEAVYDEDEKSGVMTEAVTLTEDGRQRNNPGQYL